MDIQDLANRVAAGERRALARAITLVESARKDHRAQATELLEAVAPLKREALRIGLSGTPGVGKSTFIEAFGMFLIEQGLKVAVLAVDPSSARSGGSILGDKTRMESLSREKNAFIRPSPSQAQMGGVARRSREAVALCEAAGFDVVLIETVGVGQSETMVAEMADLFLLLIAPAGGDELQGVKRGIMEIADIILVNKADGPLKETAMRTCADYAGALRLLRKRPYDPEGFPKAQMVSAVTHAGLPEAWEAMTELSDWRRAQGHWSTRRAEQARHWFEEDVRLGLLAALEKGDIRARLNVLGGQVARGEVGAGRAAEEMIAHIHADIR
ncbi:methylmalonyl Co-A mutase-associated GTPase MeaB [Aliiroseovarius crassostreae]|uniref:methylmalonyl Co-A mutase-associated GTPase MeaB n=1 Tax=Aliiroseovarius crassostreae TaxID=154981 RepID=UPI0021B00CB5|nr:methylmalonyl Co-A mutase-associated GTPase MeaB [Aliiroseovarius crassostreae]UWQ01118.1 methylmalonyl Co-A mutase-associated GTPase MeaB [Aliiroseovarius crassostreae]